MLSSTSVSHAQKQRKALTKMRESAWLPRPLKGNKTTPAAKPKNPTCCSEEQQPPEPPVPHLPASKPGMRTSRFQHMAVPDHRHWVHQGLRCVWAATPPLACTRGSSREGPHTHLPLLRRPCALRHREGIRGAQGFTAASKAWAFGRWDFALDHKARVGQEETPAQLPGQGQ